MENNQDKDEGLNGEGVINSSQLRQMAPFIRVDKLRCGDVILTRAVGFDAKVIAMASLVARWVSNKKIQNGSELDKAAKKMSFSHAGIWLPIGIVEDGMTMPSYPLLGLMESDDFGVGPSPNRSFALHMDKGRLHTVAKLPVGTTEARIYRHPLFETITAEAAWLAAEKLRREHEYKDYSDYRRLLGAEKLPEFLRIIFDPVLSLKESQREDIIRGVFCSELVAEYYKLVGLSLFRDERQAHEVSPSALADAEQCYLIEEPSLIIRAEEIDDTATSRGEGKFWQIDDRKHILPMARHRTSVISTTEAASKLKLTLKLAREKRRAEEKRLLQHLISEAAAVSFKSIQIGCGFIARKSVLVWVHCVYMYELSVCIGNVDLKDDDVCEKIPAGSVYAIRKLQSTIDAAFPGMQLRIFRCQTLLILQYQRSREMDISLSASERAAARSRRCEAYVKWLDFRQKIDAQISLASKIEYELFDSLEDVISGSKLSRKLSDLSWAEACKRDISKDIGLPI